MNIYKKNLVSILFMLILLTAFKDYALGAVSISISPLYGGTTLRFDRADVQSQTSREIRVRVVSTDSQQYQVFQRWIQPPTATGMRQHHDFLKFYGLSGSNGSGTLYGNFPEYISLSDQLVYSSSGNGQSDNFVLVYQVERDRLEFAGEFVGRLMFTVRPVGSGASEEVYLDVFVDADLELSFSVQAASTANRILLEPSSNLSKNDQVYFEYQGNLGELRVYQEVLSPIALIGSQDDLAKGVVEFSTIGDSADVRVSDPQQLSQSRTLLYSSHQNKDEWTVLYEFLPTQTFPLKAGRYQGRIRYEVQASGLVKNYDMDIEVNIEPVFELQLEFPTGQIKFDGLYPGAAPQENKIHVTVNSNLNRPYMISQNVFGSLTNERRHVIQNDNFLIKADFGRVKTGKLEAADDFIPVESAKEQVIYISNSDGAPISFDVTYRVVPYDELSPGDYHTEITYTLSEI